MRVYRMNLFEGRGRGTDTWFLSFDSVFRQCAQISDPPLFRDGGRKREKKKERKMNDSSSFKKGMDRCCRCPVDGEIMGEFTYNEDKTEAKVDFQAHKFPYTASVYYQCNVRLCVKHDGGCSNTVKYEFVQSSRSFEVKCFSR